MSSNSEKKTLFKKNSVVHRDVMIVLITFQSFKKKVSLLGSTLWIIWKLFMVTTSIKIAFSDSHFAWPRCPPTHPPPLTFAAAGLLLSRPWYWQGWHQRRALTPGELGLPAVSNQVYFEVRDTRTPRAKAVQLCTPQSHNLRAPPPHPYCRYPAQLYYFQMLQQCIKGPLPKRTP